ncbi:MAG: hypothetical protein IKF51_03585 [Solobacterium sp.]|nr:hypothetical protein [Solobacterium sp.]
MKYVRILICLLLMICTGCAESGFPEEETLSALAEAEVCDTNRPNYEHVYYSYYLQPGTGRISSDETGNVFSWHGNKFTMNLNIAAVINNAYYGGQEPGGVNGNVLMSHEGSYLDINHISHNYVFSVYDAGEHVLLDYRDDRVFMNAYTVYAEVPGLAETMLETARNVQIDRVAILEVFSYRETISNMRKRLDLFEDISPENGVIDELLIKHDDYTEPAEDGSVSPSTGDE